MNQLAKGFRATAEVLLVEANFDKVPNSNVTCHKVIFRLDDGSEYPGQLCSEDPMPPFEVGDMIDITIKSFTRGIHTITLEKVTGLRVHEAVPGSGTKQVFSHLNVAGTPGAIALQAAVAHHSYRTGVTTEQVLATANEFLPFLRANTN